MTLTIIEGTTLGEFVDTAGASLGTSVTKKASELSTIRFSANGQEPSGGGGRVTIQAFSEGITRTVSFTVLPPLKVTLRLDVRDRTLRPLGDSDNKVNPNYKKDGPDARKRIIDFAKVKWTTVALAVKDEQNNPVPNFQFTMQAFVRSYSGGHDHDGDRPTGRFITKTNDTVATFQDKTGTDGKATYKYLCSGIGGVDSIFVGGVRATDTASAVIIVKITDLQELTEGDRYDLVGMYGTGDVKSQHRTNHFGTPRLIQKLKALADSLHKDSSYVMRVNDMSLIYGGPFDTENNWNTPHETHREGLNTDISYTATGDRRIPEQMFRKMTDNLNGKVKPHGHYHVTFR